MQCFEIWLMSLHKENSQEHHLAIDEPHGSLFMYFRIFALLADYHVTVSHVTGIT
jgi:hypothetical protein